MDAFFDPGATKAAPAMVATMSVAGPANAATDDSPILHIEFVSPHPAAGVGLEQPAKKKAATTKPCGH